MTDKDEAEKYRKVLMSIIYPPRAWDAFVGTFREGFVGRAATEMQQELRSIKVRARAVINEVDSG